MRSYGQLGLAQEQARILREVAIQAKIETRKRMIDLMNYERLNTPSSVDKAKAAAKLELDAPAERRHHRRHLVGQSPVGHDRRPGQEDRPEGPKVHPLLLNDKLMAHINVTTKGSYGNIGLLRKNGRFEWPEALREIATDKEQVTRPRRACTV